MSAFKELLDSHTLGELRGLVKKMNVPNYIKIAGQPEKKLPKPELIRLILKHFDLEGKGNDKKVVREVPLDNLLSHNSSEALGNKRKKREAIAQINLEADEAVKKNKGAKKIRLREEFVKKAIKKLEGDKRVVRKERKEGLTSDAQKADKAIGKEIISVLVKDRKELSKYVEKPIIANQEKGEDVPMSNRQREKAIDTLLSNTASYLTASKMVGKMNKKDRFYGGVIHELGVFGGYLLETMADEVTRETLGTKWGWKKSNTAITHALAKNHAIGKKIK